MILPGMQHRMKCLHCKRRYTRDITNHEEEEFSNEGAHEGYCDPCWSVAARAMRLPIPPSEWRAGGKV